MEEFLRRAVEALEQIATAMEVYVTLYRRDSDKMEEYLRRIVEALESLVAVETKADEETRALRQEVVELERLIKEDAPNSK